MQHQHVDPDLHVQQCFVDVLRVVFDSECDEELRVRVGVVYECSVVISVSVSYDIAKCVTVIRSDIRADGAFTEAVGVTHDNTIVSGDCDSIIIAVVDSDGTSYSVPIDSAVPGQHNVRSVGGDRGE